jgi:nitrous oxidase accessory protein NosD
MSTSAYTRIPVIVLAALALAACPFKKEKRHDDPAIYYVSASAGLDTNPGTQGSPFKTITHAMRVATRSGATVQVDPGAYNVANGETFPITVPAGVLLIGDEGHKGGGSTPTSIVGGGGQAPGATAGVGVALLPGAGSTIAGFKITNDNPALSGRYGLFLSNSSVMLRNNTVTGATHKVGIYVDASTSHVITGNWIVDNGGSSAGSGLAFGKGGVGTKVENNVITGNGFGVEYDVAGGDLGGGSAGSVGGNVISCNTQNDLVSFAQTAIMITAASNLWDHAPATRGASTGDDIYDSSGMATVNATPAAQTSNPSPCAGVTLYVSFSAGSDANQGTQSFPFKTITKAMSVATSGTTVQVTPGIYDDSDLNTPEVFPITVPAGVLLIGDEATKGAGVAGVVGSDTTIFGGGSAAAFPGVSVAVLPGVGSTIAGFTITNASGNFHDGLILSNSTVTLRNNTITGESRYGVNVDASTNHVITGNQIVNNPGSGLAFINGGVGSKVESNVITSNGVGVEYEVAGGDLGSGSPGGSTGGNVISCNVFDLFAGAAISISAAKNSWDHSPPTLGCSGAEDICDASGAYTIDTSSPQLASSPCL